MKALVFHSPKKVQIDEVPDPQIEHEKDIILRVTSTAICGSDLHIYNGFFPQKNPQVLGHEFMGVVEEVGKGITHLKAGDRVVVPFPIACGSCFFCNHALPTQCENSNPEHYGPEGDDKEKGGGLFGYTDLYGGYAGGQAEFVRVPFAHFGPRKIEGDLKDEEVLFLTDIFPTGWSAIDWARLKGGETVVVFGCGPVGIMAQKAAWIRGAARVIGVDILDYRLEAARKFAGSEVINSSNQDVVQAVRNMTDGRGADVCIDAVGLEAHRDLGDKISETLHGEVGTIDVIHSCISTVRRGGVISVVGVYAGAYHNFPFGQIFDKQLTICTGQALVQHYIDDLLKLVTEKKVRLDDIISHVMPLDQAVNAYDMFNKRQDNCVKVVLKPHG